jgi:hypothetical protein
LEGAGTIDVVSAASVSELERVEINVVVLFGAEEEEETEELERDWPELADGALLGTNI